MSPIYERIRALLWLEEMHKWLAGSGRWDFQSFTGPLEVERCESPLLKKPGLLPQQGELF